jgi:ATP-dependent DNA ligase
MRADQIEGLLRRLQPLRTNRMPLHVASPRSARFGSPLVLSHVRWVRPALVVEVKYLTWMEDRLLRQVVYEEIREDKAAREVVRETPSASARAEKRCPHPRLLGSNHIQRQSHDRWSILMIASVAHG